MHEFGIAESVLAAVEQRARGRRVAAVTVRAGAMQRIDQAAMDSAFELVAAGSVADGARVQLVVVPVRTHCNACGADAESDDPHSVCPRCGGTDVEMTGGDELLLESLQLVPDQAAPTEEVGDRVSGHSR